MAKIHLCDYGSGNVHNVERALIRAGGTIKRCESGAELSDVQALVVPGVGAFGDCMEALRSRKFEEPIKELAGSGVWILGICVGMQILGTFSEEFGYHDGLGIIPGGVRLIPNATPDGERLKRPHVGWSCLSSAEGDWGMTPLENICPETAVYFVHSYQLIPDDPKDILAYARYGGSLVSAGVRRDRVFGFQFHPEKSGYAGIEIIERFVRLVGGS